MASSSASSFSHFFFFLSQVFLQTQRHGPCIWDQGVLLGQEFLSPLPWRTALSDCQAWSCAKFWCLLRMDPLPAASASEQTHWGSCMLLKTQSCSPPLWLLRWEPVCQSGCRQCPTVWQISSWCGCVHQRTHSVPVSVHTFVEACEALSSSELGQPGWCCALAHPLPPVWLLASVLPIQNGQSELHSFSIWQ